LYSEASLPYEWHPILKARAEELGLEFFSSPFDNQAVEFLESLGVQRYKIASLEITDIPLIRKVASTQKPIIISTGLACINDIQLALDACREVGNDMITLLKCTSEYPAQIVDANLNTMVDMKSRFDVEVGLSDHTLGAIVPVVATSLGATVIEKHFTLDRALGGPDASFSMEPSEFAEMVAAVRNAEVSLGSVDYSVKEKDKLRRRSLFVTKDVKKGETFTEHNIRSVRPGHGMHPSLIQNVIGAKANVDISEGTPLNETHIEAFNTNIGK
jgi:pseudaminic acid synthase